MTAQDQASNSQDQGLRKFFRIWFGQVVSMLGTSMTGFALGVWVFQRTGSATEYAFILVFTTLPGLLIAPLAGALIDRWDRRKVMMLSDAGAAAATVALVVLLWMDKLALWHVYLIVALGATSMSFQQPAFIASVSMLLSKEQMGRAAGMMQLGPAVSRIIAPLLAGTLLAAIHIEGIVAIDFATFLIAIAFLATVSLPRPEGGGRRPGGSLRKDAAEGWRYLTQRPGLLLLTYFFSLLNLLFGFTFVLVTPLVLSFTDAAHLGIVLAIGSAGALVGSLLMTSWGGPKNRVRGILLLSPIFGLSIMLMGLRASVPLVAVGIFMMFTMVPLINGMNQTLLQIKVDPAIQGRVFAIRRMLSQFSAPVAYMAAGPLVDKVFEPMLMEDGALAGSVGAILGVGDGRGIGFLFVIMGGLMVVVSLGSFLVPRLQSLEEDMPDALPSSAPPAAAPAPPAGGETKKEGA